MRASSLRERQQKQARINLQRLQRRRNLLLEHLEERCLLSAAPPSTIGLYNPLASEFQLRFSNNSGQPNSKFAIGAAVSGLQPLAGDFDGDGLDTIGVYDAQQNNFRLRNENSAGSPHFTFAFGDAGVAYQPIAGDWDGDGIDTVGLYRADTGQFLLRNQNSAGAANVVFSFGTAAASWKALAGDWNGDGIDTVGLYDPASRTFHLALANASGSGETVFAFGGANVLPIAGDWNGDRVDTVGVYDRAKGTFSLRNSNSAGKANATFQFGSSASAASRLPIAGNWTHGAAFPAAGVYTVPGQPGQNVPTTFTWVSRSADFNNEVGMFAVDDPAGRIGNLRPSDRGYAAAALKSASRVVVFKSGERAGASKVVELLAGSHFALYMIANSTTDRFLAVNPGNVVTKQPLAYFSLPKANSDKFDHFRPIVPNLFAWEDHKGGGDRDFNDVVGRITYSLPVPSPVSPDETAPVVILSSPAADLLTNQPVVVAGRVTDDQSGVAKVQARLDAGSFFDVPINDDGSFQFTAGLALDGSQDGQHSITVRATDGAGNVSLDATRRFTIDTTRPPLSLDLAPDSDTAPLGDHRTAQALVNLAGQTEAGRTVQLLAGEQTIGTATADAAGQFTISGVTLAIGTNALLARTADAAGNTTELPISFIRDACAFDAGLTGWTVSQNGGSPAGQGSVLSQNCSALMMEGDSFLVTLSRSVTIPETPSVLDFGFSNLEFDGADQDFINDAFEVALVDQQGVSLVPTFLPARDAFFNATEGLPAAVGSGVLVSGNRVTVNLAGLTPGAAATLVVRLANDDSDTRTQVQIDDVNVRAATPAELQQFAAGSENTVSQAAALAGTASGESSAAIDFSRFSDITASFSDLYFRTSFDDRREELFVDLASRNDGTFQSSVPLLVSVTNVSDPSVRVRDADGFTPQGAPFFDLSRQLADETLSPGESSSTRSLAFYNPNHIPFTFNLTFYGLLNQSPSFTSEPDEEALVGQTYIYQAQATDPNGDPLAFSLLTAPSAAAIDPKTGRISFTPTAADLGTHSVSIQVSDGHGGSAVQNYVLTVDTDIPNRPPVFTSAPIVDANVHTPYLYAPEVLDADNDLLSFALATAPDGMTIDPATGAVTWTPAANQLGENAVQIAVSDGRGGAAEQSFTILVQQEAGNHAPIIISEPVTRFALPDATLIGPRPYLSRADSPFDLSALGTSFFLEDFEDHQLNTPGLSVNNGIPASQFGGGTFDDSVDGDDGVIDGNGTHGDDWFGGNLRFSFDPNVLGGFPTEAGLVWTDGSLNGDLITFEAFDAQGQSLGKVFGNHGDGSIFGETAEDRFYGVTNPGGISAISVINASGGLEVDHVQYGFSPTANYQYQVRALDPDGDSLSFTLPTAPLGASIDSQGLITFPAQVGEHPFAVRASDGRGGFDTQSFHVAIDGNRPPVITSTPVTEFSIPPGDSSPASGDVQPTAINLRLANGETHTVTVQLNLPTTGSLVPNADVFLLFDDTGSFAGVAPAVIAQVQPIIDQLQAALPNVHFGFGVGRFEDYANLTTGPQDRPFLLNQPIIATDQAGFQDAITGALARQAPGGGGDTPESFIEALFQTATGLGFDGNNDGDTTDTGAAGTIAAQVVANASGDVPAFTSIDDPVGFSFRMLDVANLPTLPLDTTITRTMNPGSLNDVFQFQGTAGERLFFDSQSVTFAPPAVTRRTFAVEQPRWSLFDSQNRLVARDDLANDRELTLPATDTYVLFVENNDVEGPLDYSFRLTTPETVAVPYVPGTFISASISEPRERDQYTFTLAAPTRLVFDEITGIFGFLPFTWSLEGPSGTLVQDRQLTSSPPSLVPESSIQLLPAGDYRLTISGIVDATGDYQFRLSNLADATPINADTIIDATFDHPLEAKLFRFDAQAGDHISFEDLARRNATPRLIDPFGQTVFQQGGFDEATLTVTGTYTLVIQNFPSAGPERFIINKLPLPAAPIAIGVGAVVTGSIDSRTETDAYSFSLASPTHVYFDSLDNRGASLQVRLTDSQNNAYLDTGMDGADGRRQNKPFLFLPAGDYKIVVASNQNSPSTGPYSFQMKDVASAAVLTYGVPKDGTLSLGIETDIYTLSGTQGDQVSFLLQSPSFDFFRLLSPTGDILSATTFNHPVTATLPLTGTYRVLVEGNGLADEPYTVTADLLGNVPVTLGMPLTLGDTVSSDISAPGEVDRYTFTLNGPRTLSFDALLNSGVQWSLSGPDGFEVQNANYFLSDGSFDGVFSKSPLRLDAGSYQLSITSGVVDSYSFRLIDLAAAIPIDLGVSTTGGISPKSETDMFRFNVTTPGRFFFDNQTAAVPGGPSVQLVLVNPQGFRVLSTGFLSDGSPLDAEAVLTSPGTYTVLLEGELQSRNTGNYQIAVQAVPSAPPTVINFGQLVDTSISEAGKQDVYTFTLPQDGAIYMDAMTNDGNLRYTLTGPMGTIVNAQDFTALESAATGAKVRVNPFPAPAGQYTITVDALGDATPSYRFRVLNPAQAATSISLDTLVTGTLDPGSTSQFFRLEIPQSGTYYFDNRTPPPPPSAEHLWRLYDPFGNVVFSRDFDDAEVKLPFAGSYTLLLEGNISNQAPVPFEFFVRQEVANTIPLALNQTISGNLANAGDADRYVLSLARETLVYFDALTNDNQLTWSLEGPEGPVRLAAFVEEPFARFFNDSEGADRNQDSFEAFRLPAGEYVVTIDGTSDHTGEYQFRLDDVVSAIRVIPGTPFSGELSPPNETDLYRFEATAGDQMIVHSQGPSSGNGTIYNLIDPYGQIVTPLNPFDQFVLGDDFGFTVPRTGTYTLLVEGRSLDTRLVPYTFNIEPVATTTLSAPVTDTLTLDSLQSGQLEDLRSFKTITFAGQAGQRLFFDGIQTGGSTVFRLVTPSGKPFFGLVSRPINIRRNGTVTSPVANLGPFTLPETGTYQLIIDDTEDSVGRRAPDAILGGVGFRPGALPIILAATDTGTAFQPDGIDPIVGAEGVSVPLSDFTATARSSTPQGRGASIQQTISALNSLGALVIGLGTNGDPGSAPRRTLEAISRVTGAVNASADTLDNNTSDPIGPGDPFYYQIQDGRAGSGSRTAQGITAAILQSLHNVSFDVDVVPSDPSVVIDNLSGIRAALRAGDTANFDIRFTSDGQPHSFDLLFVKAGTGVVLGSIPVRINANPYAYDVEATDPDGDAVAFALADPPAGASIDPQTGLISFVPDGPGLFPFTVEATDSRGGASTQQFFVTVNDGQPNELPTITSPPITTTLIGQPYAYTVTATDPDGDSLSFFLAEAPYGMTINPSSGEITWTPSATQLGSNDVTVRVLDAHGGAATQSFQVAVTTDSVQAAPRIVSTPPTAAEVGRLLRYDVSAIDSNLDPLQFDLPVKSPGMVIDPEGGTFVWRPTLDQLGTHDVILRVRDGRGGVELQAFQITVTLANTAPVITSRPTGSATADLPFAYQVRAQDAEDDTLAYSLQSALPGMAVDPSTGLFSWTPTIAQLGSALVTIVVTDPQGAVATQDVLITVDSTSTNQPPIITSSPRLRTGLQTLYLYPVRATDPNGDPLTHSLTTAPDGMNIDAAGLVSWQPAPNQLGLHSVQVQVSDGRGGIATQSFSLEVLSQPVNSPPEITSAAPTAATIGRPFAYDPTAVDADNDLLFWSLDEAPIGVSIDPEFGHVRWTPAADQRGPQTIVLRVTDPLGGSTTQTLSLDVRGANVPPVFAKTPITRAAVNQPYRYAPRAFDRDGDIPTFRLTQAPLGMTIDGATGAIDWTPTQDQLGVQDVALVVDDGQGGSTRQLFRILVTQTLNRPPEITSKPPTAGSVGFTYQYDANATDPDGDALSFDVLNPPLGMFIDFATGLLTWVPQPGQAGQHTVTVQVTDALGAVASQAFTIDVALDNNFPELNGLPLTGAAAGQFYRFDVPASDPDGDLLSYYLDTGPAGMTIDAFGRVLWQTTPTDVGNHPVQITIADNRGAEIELDYTITVAVDQAAPRVQLAVSENPVNIGGTVSFLIRATDDIAVASLLLTVNGTPVPIDRNGRGTFLARQAGLFQAIATATDSSGNTATSRLSLQVRDPSDVNAPTALITSPDDDAVITTFTDIIGTVNDDNLVSYTLAVAPAEGGDFTEIARGTTPVVAGLLGRFDPTLLQNDSYVLRLTAVDAGGNVSVDEQRISVRGNLKVGEFKLSFVDVNVPVLGVPILVARTYSSFDAQREQSLGFGWHLSVQDVELRTNVPKTGDEADGIFNPFFDNARVYVTLPGGHREGFTFKPRVTFNLFGLRLFRPEFVPDAGVTSQLTVDPFDLTANDNGEFFGMAAGGLPYNPADSAFGGKYFLTTQDGVNFEIDGQTGDLHQVTTPNGETLTYSRDQITSSAGLTVTFGRDLQDRITSVTDPNGGTVRYSYDANGDLATVTDRTGNVTRLEYSATRPHFLEKVIDPLVRTGTRVEYDVDGRLVRRFDADGNEVQFINDLANSRQTIVDQRGNPTTYEYDDRGNIVTVIDALGGITRQTFDDNDYNLTTTDPLGHTTARTFDPHGNVLSESDPLGNVTRTTYDGLANVLTDTDPLGNTSTLTYSRRTGDLQSLTLPDGFFFSAFNPNSTLVILSDPQGQTRLDLDRAGNTAREVDPLGNERQYTYDSNGKLLTITVFRTIDGVRRGLTTRFEYDAENRRISVLDPLGNISRTEYDAVGQQTAEIDGLGHRTTYEYDARGLLVRTRFPDGTTEEYAYDEAGNKIRSVDQAGRATLYRYDALNRLVATIYPDGTPGDDTDNPRWQLIFDAAGHEVATIDENGHRTDYEYDAAGRRHRTLLPEVLDGSTGTLKRPEMTAEYDALGNHIATTDANGNRTEYEYDSVGRRTLTRFVDGSTVQNQFDAGGRRIAATDQTGQTTSYAYDADSHLTSVSLPAPAAGQPPPVTRYTYDEVGNRLTQTDALSHTTTLTYDETNRLKTRQRPSGVMESFVYDAVGNPTSHTDFNGATTQFSYDTMNRVVRKDYPDSTFVTTTYTPTGLLATETDSRGIARYAYDERDRLLSRRDPDGQMIGYTYDAAGNRLSVLSPVATTHYAYDALNRMTIVTDSRGGLTKYQYDLRGNQLQTNFPNGVVETRGYDELNRVKLVHDNGPGGLLASFEYTFDPVGRRTSVVEGDGRHVDYGYDLTGRLIGETISKPGTATQSIAYAYDAVGNRLSRTDSAAEQTTYEYNANDELLREVTGGQATTYSYDNNGNTIAIASPTEQRSLAWDAENRLAGITLADASGAHQIRNQYNPAGLRVSQTVDGQETRYLVDELLGFGEVLEEYRPTGAALAEYTYGIDLIAQERAGQTSFFQADNQGSTRLLTDQNGAATDRYFYDAYGNIAERSGSTANSYLYDGEQFDAGAAAYYLRARYYDQAIGRLFSVDPEAGTPANPLSLHRYLFANADPMNHADPSGRTATSVAELEEGQALTAVEGEAEVSVENNVISQAARATSKIRTTTVEKGIEKVVEKGISDRTRKEIIDEAVQETRRILREETNDPKVRGKILENVAEYADSLIKIGGQDNYEFAVAIADIIAGVLAG